jgi:type I restriction enzyme S subunit
VKSIKLGEVARIYNGNSINEKVKAKNFTGLPSGTPYIATKDISYTCQVEYENGVKIPTANESEFKLAKKGAVLLCAEGGSAGRKMAIIERDVFFGNKLFCFECDTELNSKFLFYYLQAPTFQDLFKSSIAGLIGGVSLEKVRNLPIVLPSLEKQTEIVEKLDTALSEIELLEGNLEICEERSNELLHSLLNGSFTYTLAEEGSNIALSNQEIDARLVQLKDVVSFDKKQGSFDLAYVGLEDIESNTGSHLGSREPKKVKSNSFAFTSEHLLYGRLRPYLNKVLLPDFDGHCSTEIFPIKVTKDILREYLCYWFRLPSTVEAIDETSTGARMPRANMDAVLEFQIPLPPIEKQKEIVQKLDNALGEIDLLKAQIKIEKEYGVALRQSLLSSAFSQKEAVA